MDLPPSAQEIADIIGREAALVLIGALPTSGNRAWRRVLYVPKRMGPDHWLIELLGPETAERLRRHFGGAILQPANCGYLIRAFRNREIARMARDGLSQDQIAEAVGLSKYRIAEILRDLNGNPPEETPQAGNDNGQRQAKGRGMNRVNYG